MTFPFTRSTSRAQFNPHTLHEQLVANSDYRQRFADRVQKHLFNGGALDTSVAVERLDVRAGDVADVRPPDARRVGR